MLTEISTGVEGLAPFNNVIMGRRVRSPAAQLHGLTAPQLDLRSWSVCIGIWGKGLVLDWHYVYFFVVWLGEFTLVFGGTNE